MEGACVCIVYACVCLCRACLFGVVAGRLLILVLCVCVSGVCTKFVRFFSLGGMVALVDDAFVFVCVLLCWLVKSRAYFVSICFFALWRFSSSYVRLLLCPSSRALIVVQLTWSTSRRITCSVFHCKPDACAYTRRCRCLSQSFVYAGPVLPLFRSTQEQLFISGGGLLPHLVKEIASTGMWCAGSLQTAFDLLGELCKGNREVRGEP